MFNFLCMLTVKFGGINGIHYEQNGLGLII